VVRFEFRDGRWCTVDGGQSTVRDVNTVVSCR
jgi:hypothetical protein